MNDNRPTELDIAEQEIHRAARHLGLSEREESFLLRPSKEITITFPVHVGDEIRHPEAYLTRFWPYPSRGGMRIDRSITLAQVRGLAAGTRVKHGLWADKENWYLTGGGKLGVALDPKSLDPLEYKGALRSLTTELGDDIGSGIHVIAPDIGSDTRSIAIMMDELARTRGFQPDAFAGKPVLCGGRETREPATGYGGALAVTVAAPRVALSLPGAKVAVCGFGAAGTSAASRLAELGAVLVAASNVTGAVRATAPGGLDVKALEKHVRRDGHAIPEFPGGEPMPADELFGLDVDVLVLAALGGMVTVDVAERIRASIICEVVHGPVTRDAESLLVDDGRIVIPDVVGGGLGAYASALELRGAPPGDLWPALRTKALAVNAWVNEKADTTDLTLRSAAWTLGLKPVLDHARDLGRI